ncbi:hypothetical protein ACWDR0_10305 [Streptomyces sp. NPDC003691]
MSALCLTYGGAVLVCDHEEWVYTITAPSDARPADVAEALAAAELLGLEPIQDELPDILDDGSVLMWMHPADLSLNPFETETRVLCTSSI